jgi:hypothetical protein
MPPLSSQANTRRDVGLAVARFRDALHQHGFAASVTEFDRLEASCASGIPVDLVLPLLRLVIQLASFPDDAIGLGASPDALDGAVSARPTYAERLLRAVRPLGAVPLAASTAVLGALQTVSRCAQREW